MLKQCFLHGEKIRLKYKSLMFSILSKALIIREFASERESARKYALDFWGRTENSDEKTAGCRKSVSGPYCFHPDIENKADTGAIPQFFIIHRLVIRPQVFILQLWLSWSNDSATPSHRHKKQKRKRHMCCASALYNILMRNTRRKPRHDLSAIHNNQEPVILLCVNLPSV